jgi:putative photosynthetic complex assembly protein
MSQSPAAERTTPIVLFGTMAIALLLVSLARVNGYTENTAATAAVVASCDLVFEDLPGGAIHVYNLADGRLLERFERGNGSFVRGVMRSMTRERHSRSIGAEKPFRLSRHSDGALMIRDQATGTEVFLNAFGPSNAEVFARLLAASRSTT